jgi:hypothetical protein
MSLSPAQLATLKADILADNTLNSFPNNDDGNIAVAAAYNLNASPAFTVWRTHVPIQEVGQNFNATELGGLTTANTSRLQCLAQYLSFINASIASNRQFFDDIFSGAGGANTRAALLIIWKRLASRVEKLYATGTGSDVSPATLVFEGTINHQDVQMARSLP